MSQRRAACPGGTPLFKLQTNDLLCSRQGSFTSLRHFTQMPCDLPVREKHVCHLISSVLVSAKSQEGLYQGFVPVVSCLVQGRLTIMTSRLHTQPCSAATHVHLMHVHVHAHQHAPLHVHI